MKLSWPRYTLRQLAIVIAILAVGFALLGVELTIVAVAFCLPAVFARRGQRLAAFSWVAASYPIIALISLYLTWIMAWCALGHRPRSSLDDPKDIHAIEIPYTITGILLVGILPALFAVIILTLDRLSRWIMTREKGTSSKVYDPYSAFRWGTVPVFWVVAYICLRLDPLLVFDWFMD